MCQIGEHRDFVADEIPLEAQDLADVHDDIEFLAAVIQSGDGFEPFDRGAIGAVRESDGCRGFDVGTGQTVRGAFEVVGHDADAGDIVSDG